LTARPVFAKLAAGGVAVHTYDAVGHGRSEAHPRRGRWNCERWGELVEDGTAFSRAALAAYPQPPPAFVAGQSLGGLLACYVALAAPALWAQGGLVLLSAAVNVEWTLHKRVLSAFGGLFSLLAPDAAMVPAAPVHQLSRVKEVQAAFSADPLNCHAQMKVRIAKEAESAFAALASRYGELSLPLLAMHGTADAVTSLPAVRLLVAGAASADKQLVPWEGAFHELVNEPEQGAVLDLLLAWLLERAKRAAKL